MPRRIFLYKLFLCVLAFLVFPVLVRAADTPIGTANDLSLAFEKVADVISPSVVTVNAVVKAKPTKRRAQRNDPFFDPYRDFFGDDFFDRLLPPDGSEGFAQQGMGTGVIVDTEGHILTNNHVVAGADEVTVRLQNEKTYKAKIIGTDPKTDLAVIQVKAPDLQAARLGDSEKLRIGEWVVAAGNPFGLSNSITSGIVSAKGRSFMGGGQFEDFIQTDAAINPGNSGGPLVNLEGEVVGINTAIFSKSGGYMGIGFAIPINMAKTVMTSLIKSGKVVRGWLGVGIQPITEEAAQSFGYTGTDGALVGHVETGSPAEKAGIKQGDIVVGLNGEKIKTVNQLRNIVAASKPDSRLEVELYRENQKLNVSVKIGELKSQHDGERATEEQSSVDLGINLENLDERLARELGTKRMQGVVVTAVRPGSLGEEAGLQVRDIIVSVNGKKVKNVTEFNETIAHADLKKGARLVVETQGMEHFVFPRAEE
jgi:serine protease Do